MFIRFRERGSRLHITLAETFRVGGRVRQRHVAVVGSIGNPPTIGERIQTWKTLVERLATADDTTRTKTMAALQTRVPYVTQEEAGDGRAEQDDASGFKGYRS